MEQHLLRDANGDILPQFRHWVVGSKWGSPLHQQKRTKNDDGLLDHVFLKGGMRIKADSFAQYTQFVFEV